MSATYGTHIYAAITRIEKHHYWFRIRNLLIRDLTTRFLPTPQLSSFLEIGFGTGVVLRLLSSLGYRAEGIDVNDEAVRIVRKSLSVPLYRKSLFSFRSNKHYGAVGIFDVLEHQGNDRKFLQACLACVKEGGYLFLTVPALPWLWTDIDRLSGHKRRYTKTDIVQKVEEAGGEVVFVNYWMFVALPFYFCWRIFVRFSSSPLERFLQKPPVGINRLLYYLGSIERLIFLRAKIPLGSSLFLVAKKRSERSGGITSNNAPWRDVFRNDTAGSDHRMFSNSNAW